MVVFQSLRMSWNVGLIWSELNSCRGNIADCLAGVSYPKQLIDKGLFGYQHDVLICSINLLWLRVNDDHPLAGLQRSAEANPPARTNRCSPRALKLKLKLVPGESRVAS
jgi:hypothetical protein